MADTGHDASGMAILSKADAAIRMLAERGECTAATIALALDEPQSSVYRLLTNLQLIGWIDRGSRRGLYRLGVRVMLIGARVEDRLDLREACNGPLRALRTDLRVTSFLCVRRGPSAVCIERFEGRDVRSLAMRLGDSLPLSHGAAPRAILAHLPTAERQALITQVAESDSPGERSRVTAAELQRVVEEARSRGYTVSDGDVTPGIAAIGAPVFNHRGELEGAVSISGVRALILDDQQGNADAVMRAAAEASSALGFPKELP